MKLLFCGKCGDIKSLPADGSKTSCVCGNITARWENPRRGTVRVEARDREWVRFIGLNNSFLTETFRQPHATDEHWRGWHDLQAKTAEGYLFHKDKRNCWAVLVKVGDSNDIRWEDDPTANPS